MVNRTFASAPPDISIALQLVNEHILGQGQRCVAIVVASDLLGIVTMSDLRLIPAEEWPTTSVFRVMTPKQRLHTVSPEDDITNALEMMAEYNIHQLPVIDSNRDFVGFITRADVLRLIHIRTELSGAQPVDREPPARV